MANPSSTSPTPLCRIVAVLVSSIPFLCASAVGIETVVQRTFDAVPEGARSDNFYQPAFFQLSSDERLLLLGRGTEIHVYDIKTRCLVERIEFGRGTFIGGAVLDPSGRFLLYSTETAPSYDPEVRLRSLQTGRETDPAYFEIDFERPESEVTEPIVIDSAELDPDRPIRCSVLPGSAIFVDLGSGGSLRLPFTTSFDAEARRRTLPGALSTRDGMTIRWEGGSTLRWTDRNGGSFVAPLIADPELRCVRVAELHFGGDGRLLFGGIDAGRFLLVDVFDDELIFDAVAFRIGARAFPADQFDLALNRPASVLAALGADDEMVRAAESARSRRLRRLGLAEEDLGLSPDLPAITVLNRDAIPLAVEKGEITLRVRASRTARPLDRLLLYVNGVPVLGSRGKSLRPEGAMEASMDIPVRLASGPNKVQVSAVDTWGAESIRETVYVNRASPREEGGKVYILSIGVSDYEDEELDLGLAAKDARDIVAAFAANRGDRAQVVHRILEDRVATRENILASRSLFDTCEADDLAVVFIAGHGFQDENYEYWFGTPDIDHEHPARRGLSFDDLESLFDGIAAQRRLLLMDTCFAGEVDPDEIAATLRSDESTTGVSVRAPAITRSAAAGDGRRSGPANLAERFFAEFRKGTGATVLTASAGVEFVFAEETDDIGNGVFTHCVMRVLREPGLADEDGDGAVRASELLRYVSREVPLLTSQRQVPTGRQLNRDLDMVVSDSPRD